MSPPTAIFKPTASRQPAILQAEVLWPVLVVCGLWLVMSLGTNAYLAWVETEYDRLFAENLRAIRQAADLDADVWRLYSGLRDPARDAAGVASHLALVRSRLFQIAPHPDRSGQRDAEQERSLESHVSEFLGAAEATLSSGHGAQDTGVESSGEAELQLLKRAADVSESATLVRMAHGIWIDERRQMLAELHLRVVLLRSGILLLGLPIGILLGWRVARRLQSTAARIAVTLNEPALADPSSGMTVQITRDSTFDDVHRQAERVAERVRTVLGELQAARREVIQSERLAAVGELAAGVAHELRNPLTSVKLLLQHAARQPADYRISEQKLQLILEEIRRMEVTIQGLLDFARRPALRRVRHDLRETLQRSLNLVEGRMQQSGVLLRVHISTDPLWVMGDAELLSQVFVNLFLNATEALTAGGQLRVATEPGSSGDRVRVTVSDTGSGFPSDVLTRLFEPFATTKERGTGLGLAICRRIVLEHAGQIHAGNSAEGGAVVSVELPLDTATPPDLPSPLAPDSPVRRPADHPAPLPARRR
ncbi:MAG: ATP-binding protein [Planctomycetota bacterium]